VIFDCFYLFGHANLATKFDLIKFGDWREKSKRSTPFTMVSE
jgi:hypothetical protein